MKLNIRYIKFAPIIGFGYWKDTYQKELGMYGCIHNFVIPFVRIQYGSLQVDD